MGRDDSRLRADILESLPRLRRFARSIAGSLADADDLTQSTVERALERGVPDDADVLKWMFRVCRNLHIDELRARDVRRKAATRPELGEQAALSGEAVAVAELSLREVDRAMQSLPEEQRVVLSLVAVEGLSYRAAAEVLEMPIGTVMSRLSRARAALADRLQSPPAARTGGILLETGND